MKIGIDFDSTIAKIDQPWLDRLNALRATNYRAEDWRDWDLSFLKPEEKPLFFSLFTPDIYDTVEPYPDAPEAIRSLAAHPGVKLVCVTSNPEKDSDAFTLAKRRWLQKHIPELSNSIVVARKKSGLGLDVLVDDAPHHHENTDYIAVLVDRPWNTGVGSPSHFERWIDGKELLFKMVKAFQAGTNNEHPKKLR